MPAPLDAIFADNQPFSSDITPFYRYTDMLTRFENALQSGDVYVTAWRQMIRGFRGLDPDLQIIQVNETMNRRPYVPEIRDYWAQPGEFLQHGGDCEDFCIAKYLALRDLGFDEGAMRIVIVTDLQKQIPHAILAVQRDEGDELILDNQSASVRRAADIHRYAPIYSINRLGWWYHQKMLTS